jgi:ribosome recycling factor
MPKSIMNQGEEKMKKSIEALKKELAMIRTGRANPAILNTVTVDYYGVQTPISQIAGISSSDAQTIVVKPYDTSILSKVEKAIQTANLGYNPINDGTVVRIPIPPLNEATRKELVKQAKKLSEDGKIAIRNIRRDVMDSLKKLEKDSLISEDELKKYTETFQKTTDKYTTMVDDLIREKESAIMTI